VVRERVGIVRLSPQRRGDELERLRIAPLLVAKHAEQVLRIEMSGIGL
jgi:hypothetical protein